MRRGGGVGRGAAMTRPAGMGGGHGGGAAPPLGAPTPAPAPAPASAPPPPAEGEVVRGRVSSVKAFGAFVALEGCPGLEGLVHVSQVSAFLRPEELRDEPEPSRVAALESFCRRGDRVWVKVLRAEPAATRGGWRVSLSLRAACQETGADLDPGGSLQGRADDRGGVAPPSADAGGPGRGSLRDDPPEAGSVHHGAVHAVKPFGVFVVIPGFRRRGLVPLHQVSAYLDVPREASDEEKVAALSEALGSDPQVWFKVVEVQPDDGDGRGAKVACSIKNVAQHDGRDLDPHNLNYRPRGGGRADGGGRGGTDPATLPAAHQLASFAREEMALRTKGPAKGGRGEGYELLLEPGGEEDGGGAPPPPEGDGGGVAAGIRGGAPNKPGAAPTRLPPMGRGAALTQPAWMTGAAGDVPTAPPRITSVEQALEVLKKYEEEGSSGSESSDSRGEGRRRRSHRRRHRRRRSHREGSPEDRGAGEGRRRKRSRRPSRD